MKRLVILVLAVAMCCLLLAAATVAYFRWSTGLVASALEKARQAEAAGEDEVAAEQYQKYIYLSGQDADPAALADRSLLLLRLASLRDASPKDVGRAFDAAEVAIRQRPDDMRVRRRLGELKFATGDYNEAREHLLVFRDAVERGTADGDLAAIDVQIARTWYARGDHRQALAIVAAQTGFDVDSRSFPPAVSKTTPRADAYLLLAEIVRDKLGDQRAAERIVECCMKAYPDDPAVLIPYAELMLSRNEPAAALRAATRAAAAAPSDPLALLANARALAATGEVAAASTAFAETRRTFPDNSPVFAAAARHLAALGTTEQVLEMVDAALERFPFQEYDVFVFLSNMRVDFRARAEFVKRLETAREKYGADYPPAVVLAGRALEATGRFSAAEKPLVKARGLVPEEAKISIDEALARCHAAIGDWDETIDDYQRLDQTWFGGERATAGIAAARFELGQRTAAAEIVGSVERTWLRQAEPGVAFAIWNAPIVSTMIRVIAAQPAAKRDWSGVERILELISAWPRSESDLRLEMLQVELLAAKGEVDAAISAVPAGDPAKPAVQFDPLRLTLVARRDGIAAMRESLAALPRWRRDRPEVFMAVAGAEARHATGDDRGWIRSIAAATDRIAAADEALHVLQTLAGLANAAGWYDEARAIWGRAAARLPDDFRPPLALAIDAARAGDADAGAKAATQLIAIEGKDSPRGRVAAAAALVAAARAGVASASPSGPAKLGDAQRRQLDEARKLLVEARNERKRWQPVESLSADIELIAGRLAAAVGHLQRARAYGPEDPRLTRLLAESYERCGRRADADQLRETIAPAGLAGGDRLVIDSLLASSDFGQAADRALAVIDVEAADVATLIWLGRLCARAGMQERAGELLTRVTRADSSNPDAWIWLARWQVSQGAKETAEETIAAGIEAVPEAQRRLLAARGAAVTGRTEEAERRFREAAQESGGDIAPAAYTVDFLIEQNRGKEAEAFLREIIDGLGVDRRGVKAWATQRLADLRDVSWK